MRLTRTALEAVYEALAAAYGPQRWWPAQTPFEVMAGAILTQRTAWRNVELALDRLRGRGALEASVLARVPPEELEALVRPAGFYRQKAARLLRMCEWLAQRGGFEALAGLDDTALRGELLQLSGIGPETADAILLYAFGQPTFVVDAYARRIFARLGLIGGEEPYEALRMQLMRRFGGGPRRLGEYHALLVAHGKAACRTRPRCAACALEPACEFARQGERSSLNSGNIAAKLGRPRNG